MEIEVDPQSTVPLYQQLRDRVVELIGAGQLRRGDGLASVRSLAGAFRINPATVGKGYDLLRSQGLVATNAKSGTFVARDRESGPPTAAFVDDWTQRLVTLLAEGRAQGLNEHAVLAACRRTSSLLEEGRTGSDQ